MPEPLGIAIDLSLIAVWGWIGVLFVAHGRRFAANRRFAQRMRAPLPPASTLPLTVIVPVKGDVEARHLALGEIASREIEAELFLVMETIAEPAYATAQTYLAAHPESRWQILLAGPCPPGDNGKIHNLRTGIDAARGGLLFFVDADVELSAPMLHHGAHLLSQPGVGAVFCPPFYEPTGRAGPGLLAAYVNYWFMPSMARADAAGRLTYCAGACYGLAVATYQRAPIFHRERDLISEDAALGAAIVAAGLTVRLVPAVARMPSESNLTLAAALAHLRRWTLLGRVMAPASFRKIGWTLEVPWLLLGFLLLEWRLSGLWQVGPWLVGGMIATALWAWGFTRVMNRLYWGQSGPVAQAGWWIVFQCLLVPLWWEAMRTRRMHWRGREYELDAAGRIVGWVKG